MHGQAGKAARKNTALSYQFGEAPGVSAAGHGTRRVWADQPELA